MIRPAEAADIPAIHRLIRDLAEYEKALAEVTATEEDLRPPCSPTWLRLTARSRASRCGS